MRKEKRSTRFIVDRYRADFKVSLGLCIPGEPKESRKIEIFSIGKVRVIEKIYIELIWNENIFRCPSKFEELKNQEKH